MNNSINIIVNIISIASFIITIFDRKCIKKLVLSKKIKVFFILLFSLVTFFNLFEKNRTWIITLFFTMLCTYNLCKKNIYILFLDAYSDFDIRENKDGKIIRHHQFYGDISYYTKAAELTESEKAEGKHAKQIRVIEPQIPEMMDPDDIYRETKKYLKGMLPSKYKILNQITMNFQCTDISLFMDKVCQDINKHISLIIYIPTINFYNDIISDYFLEIHDKTPIIEINLGLPYSVKTINDDYVYKVEARNKEYLNKIYNYIITNITQ